jgi:antitoxin component YwqK of YwqJK toxin-antitoxin module
MIFPFFGLTQKVQDITHRNINIHHQDSSINFNVLTENLQLKPSVNKIYYWYHRDAIYTNQGGYKEKLLDGKYRVNLSTGQLVTEGYFKNGLKIGVWKKWNDKGELLNLSNWEKGLKNGTHEDYGNGHLIKKYNYKNDLLHGKYITYQNDTIYNQVTYKKGELIPIIPKERKEQKEKKEIKLKEEDKNKNLKKNKKKE